MSKLNVRVMKSAASTTSKQIYADEFKTMYGDDIIEPPYNLKELKTIAEYSSILQQCIDAYKTNIVSFGFLPEYTFDFNAESVDQTKKNVAEKEWTELEEFIRYLNYDDAAEVIIGHSIEDRERTGNGYTEVFRDGIGKPAEIAYMDSQYMRVCKKTESIEISVSVMEKGHIKKRKRVKRFRKYVQMVGKEKVYFKEYGDPRIMSKVTGKYDENIPIDEHANEVIHFKIGSGTYGIPRWIGNMISLYGARKAEELNWMYFKQGRHTPAAITIENGMLSEGSYQQLQEYMDGLEGVENAHKFLLLEAEGITGSDDVENGKEEKMPVKVQIKSLAEMVQQDALFLEYDEKSRDKLRSSFRLPPLYTGESQDYNKSTSDTARKITEEQVFQPERSLLCGRLNTLFMPDLEFYLVKLSLKGPDFRDPVEIAKVLAPFINARAIAPNDLRDLVGRILGKTLDEWPEDMYNRPMAGAAQNSNPLLQIEKAKGGSDKELVMLLKDIRDVIEGIKNG